MCTNYCSVTTVRAWHRAARAGAVPESSPPKNATRGSFRAVIPSPGNWSPGGQFTAQNVPRGRGRVCVCVWGGGGTLWAVGTSALDVWASFWGVAHPLEAFPYEAPKRPPPKNVSPSPHSPLPSLYSALIFFLYIVCVLYIFCVLMLHF